MGARLPCPELARSDRTLAESAMSSLVDVVNETVRATPTPTTVTVTVDVDLPDLRLGLPHALAVRALAPVVANAVRFATSSVRIVVPSSMTTGVELTVEDDGPGVQADPERIFEAGTTSGGGSGAGLGLALARRIARSCDGDVELTQRQGPTRFTVRLPGV